MHLFSSKPDVISLLSIFPASVLIIEIACLNVHTIINTFFLRAVALFPVLYTSQLLDLHAMF